MPQSLFDDDIDIDAMEARAIEGLLRGSPPPTPRPYQLRCVDAILREWLSSRSTLAVLATGLGKSVIAACLCQRLRPELVGRPYCQRDDCLSSWPEPMGPGYSFAPGFHGRHGHVLMLAHREELVRQNAEKIEAVCLERAGVEMAGEVSVYQHHGRTLGPRLTVASVQSLVRPNRLARYPRDWFDAVIVDEAHHAVAGGYRAILDHFHTAKVLGITATPGRADNLALGQVFESVAFNYGLKEAIRDGYLCPVEQHVVTVADLDFSDLRKVRGDFTEEELEKILTEENVLHRMALPALELAGDRQGIFFCVNVLHAELMAAMLRRYKQGCAVALDGETDAYRRRGVIQDYKDGKIQWLVNCGLFLEGFDAPNTRVVAMGRPTQSTPLYAQVLGRGTRTLPGVIDQPHLQGDDAAEARRAAIADSDKPACIVLDFVGNAGKHQIVTALDLLGGEYGVAVRECAKKLIAEEGKAGPVDRALELAELEVAFTEEHERFLAEQKRRALIKAQAAEYVTQQVSPFGGDGGSHAGEDGEDVSRIREPATAKQVNLLVYRFGWSREKAESLHKRQASLIIDKLMAAEDGKGKSA